jgi:hypothetical protein
MAVIAPYVLRRHEASVAVSEIERSVASARATRLARLRRELAEAVSILLGGCPEMMARDRGFA